VFRGVKMDSMKRSVQLAICQAWAFISLLCSALAIRSTASQLPIQGVERTATSARGLNAAEEKDSYEIYSILLRAELDATWKISAWTINQKTQTFPSLGPRPHYIRQCLSVSRNQDGIYAPLIDDYLAKNREKQSLERKFDLPQYELVDFGQTPATTSSSFAPTVVFEVSAVGFNPDRTRALVYVGHRCGSLCGGGRYHLLVKAGGKWQIDREFRGISCIWAS
jgi:hypothetical protein